jgi:hypothetical protein
MHCFSLGWPGLGQGMKISSVEFLQREDSLRSTFIQFSFPALIPLSDEHLEV